MSEPLVGVDASRGFGEAPTGTETYVREIVTRLVRGDGLRWRLYTRPGGGAPPAPPGVQLRRLRAPRLWTHTSLAWETARRPPDLLFVPAHVMPLWTRPPCVVTVHDLGYLVHPEAHGRAQRAYLDWSTRRHVRLAAHLVADSQHTRDDLVTRYGARVERVTVVPLGVDPALAPPEPAEIAALRSWLGLPAEARFFLHVGTRQPRKNLPRLLEAFAAVAGRRPELRLVLAGGAGRGAEELDGRVAALGLEGRVLMPGYVPRERMAGLYGGALALVFPSLYEGFGLPAVEAMACGTPTALATGSSLPEVGGDAALYFRPEEVPAIAGVLARLAEDEGLRARLSARGRERAARFSWDRSAQGVRRVLERVAIAARARDRGRPG